MCDIWKQAHSSLKNAEAWSLQNKELIDETNQQGKNMFENTKLLCTSAQPFWSEHSHL